MRYIVTVDILPNEAPHFWVAAEERPVDACEPVRKQLCEGDGFDLTQALVRAGTVIMAVSRLRPELWSVVK